MRCRTGVELSLQRKCVPQSSTEPPDVQPVTVEIMSELPPVTDTQSPGPQPVTVLTELPG